MLRPQLVLPPLVFASSYYCWSFVDRLFYWWVAYAVSGGYLLTSLVLLLYNASAGKRPRPWLAYASAWLVVATAAGWYFGNGNFGLVSDFVTFKGMATYVNVNPSKEKGDGFADAGQVYFAFGVRIDESRAMMFKNTEKFCVAPIVELLDEEGQPVTGALSSGDMDGHVGETGAIDWWAVGINCCDDGFKCGDVGSPARSGLRILDTTERQFYEFAVHQFTAKYHIPSAHPLFFHWVMDPLGTVNGYMLQAQINWHTAVSYSVLLAVFFGVIARLSIDGMEP